MNKPPSVTRAGALIALAILAAFVAGAIGVHAVATPQSAESAAGRPAAFGAIAALVAGLVATLLRFVLGGPAPEWDDADDRR